MMNGMQLEDVAATVVPRNDLSAAAAAEEVRIVVQLVVAAGHDWV